MQLHIFSSAVFYYCYGAVIVHASESSDVTSLKLTDAYPVIRMTMDFSQWSIGDSQGNFHQPR